MENNRILRMLAVILLISCGIVSVSLFRMLHNMNYIPSDAVDNLVEIMARDGILLDRDIVSEKREHRTVYLFDSDDYNRTVAELLGGAAVKDVYAIPKGELLILENGNRCEFTQNFSFRYQTKGTEDVPPDIVDLQYYGTPLTEEMAETTVAAVRNFLGNGSRAFSGGGELRGAVEIDGIWEKAGIEYVLCSRTIDGVTITGNLVLCTVENGIVTAAHGTWCFFTEGTSYSAQLTDLLNILFNVKKHLTPADGEIIVESIHSCYSLYFFGEEEKFCLIPCWQITTDIRGDLIYNAIDGTLYTKIQE